MMGYTQSKMKCDDSIFSWKDMIGLTQKTMYEERSTFRDLVKELATKSAKGLATIIQGKKSVWTFSQINFHYLKNTFQPDFDRTCTIFTRRVLVMAARS